MPDENETNAYSKEEIDEKLKNLKDNIAAVAKAMKKAIKSIQIPDETDYDLINDTTDKKIELALDKIRAGDLKFKKETQDEIIALKQDIIANKNEIDANHNSFDLRLIKLEPKPVQAQKTEKREKDYPPFIIDDQGIKRMFLKINRTTKKPMYQ